MDSKAANEMINARGSGDGEVAGASPLLLGVPPRMAVQQRMHKKRCKLELICGV